ncbi:extracellular solute-binding protein [Candidatus Odyssella acanthamoebae]|uniref:extracellular solute-binding protein n=1 Tax=Candidatus Odyssella acanthamoebae TaxID=91604 RepID=UPI0012EC6EAA|nr:extracellular solute-binding protein [Candidatus Paracaedibacter acanthamoebae]
MIVKNSLKHKQLNLLRGLAIAAILAVAPTSLSAQKKASSSPSPSAELTKAQGFSVFGELKYPDGFKHYDYVNPEAPKGGRLTLSALGTFNSLNPFIVRGDYPAGVGLTLSNLMSETQDRAGECYAFGAQSIEIAADRNYVIFNINPKAQFDDGVKITAETVIWSFNILKDKGSPLFRTYYKNVKKAEKLGTYQVKFYLDDTKNAELPLILGQIYILPKHFYEKVDFGSTSLEIPPSSGPYKIKSMEPGRSITYERVKNWWGADLPSQLGANNFDEIHYEFFLDSNSQLEAFKSGRIDIRAENSIKNWNTAYNFPAANKGCVIREELFHDRTEPTYGFFFNIRHPKFHDMRVREALTIIYDFGWLNKRLFYSAYNRNLSYFPNSCFAAHDLPSEMELEILTPLKGQIPERVFTEKFGLPDPKIHTELRTTMSRAIQLFDQAGWHINEGRMVHKETNTPFTFEILIDDQSNEKICMHYVSTLERIGITAVVRSIDKAAYTQRVENKSFDMIVDLIPQSNSLGNEQRDFFGSSKADVPGSRNFAGINNPAIDEVIEKLVQSDSYLQLCHRARALDRLLLWGFYMIPAWHKGSLLVAYWDKFGHPKVSSKFNPFNIQTWWYDATKAQALLDKSETPSNRNFLSTVWERLQKMLS